LVRPERGLEYLEGSVKIMDFSPLISFHDGRCPMHLSADGAL